MLFGIIDSNQPFLFSPHLGGISVFKKKEEIINGSQFFTFAHKKNISFYSSLTKNETGFISISYGSFVEKAEKCKLLGEDLSCSDAELFLRGYLSWGEDCVHHLKGNYVFAIWNSKEEKLFIARSPISHWILYYAELPNGGFVFSTAMQALVEWGGVKKTLDKQHVAHFLTLMIRSEPLSTFFDNIKKLPTGT